MEVEMEVKIKKKINGYMDIAIRQIKVEDSDEGMRDALLGWNKGRHERAQVLYNQDFGPIYEHTNVKMEISIKEDGNEIFYLPDENGDIVWTHFWGNRKYVIAAIKGIEEVMYNDTNNFISNRYGAK